MNERNKNFAKNLRKLRDSLNLDQAEVAFKIGVNTRTYQKYEYGKTSPTDPVKQELADLFKVSISDLYSDEINPKPTLVPSRKPALILAIQSQLLTLNEDQLDSLSLVIKRLIDTTATDLADKSAI